MHIKDWVNSGDIILAVDFGGFGRDLVGILGLT